MSLLRLLTAGKSLVGLKDYQSRYVARGGLPKFGSKKNPFRATVRPETALFAAPARNSESTLPLADGAQAETEPARENATITGTAEAGREPAKGVAVAAKGAAQQNPGQVTTENLTPRSVREGKRWNWGKMAFWNKPKQERAVPQPFSKPMLQAELSLEGVKVVRNDLSDTDLEVVPCKPASPAAAPVPPAPTPQVPAAAPSGTWGRVAGRILGAGKV